MAREGTVAEVATIPNCDICKSNGSDSVPAGFDGKTKMGPWAFMCPTHFGLFGTGLGTGQGQRLVLAVEPEPEQELFECEMHHTRHPLKASLPCFDVLFARIVEAQDPYSNL